MRKEVQKYIKSKYMAASGGEVPDEDDVDETEEPVADASEEPTEGEAEHEGSPESDAPEEPSDDENENEPAAEVEAPAAAAGSSPPARDPQALKDYLGPKYAQASDDSAVKDAVAKKRRGDIILALGEGIEGALRAKGQAAGGQGVNHQSYQDVSQHFNDNIRLAETERQQAMQNVIREQAMQEHVLALKIKQGTLDERARAKQAQEYANAPGNPANVASARIFNQAYPEFKIDEQKATPALIAQAFKLASKKADDATKNRNIDVKEKGVQVAQGTREDAQKAHREQKDEDYARKDFDGLKKDIDSQTASSRSGLGTSVNKINGANRVLGFARVAPAEIEAAEKDPQAKAALIKKLDQVPPEMAAEIVSGLMATVSPGAGSLGQFEHLKADTASERLAKLKQYFTSVPQGGGTGALLYNNMESLNNELKVNQKVIDDHVKGLQKKHPDAFKHASTAQGAADLLADHMPKPEEIPGLPAATTPAAPPPAAPAAPAVDLSNPQQVLSAVAVEKAKRKALKGGTAIGSK